MTTAYTSLLGLALPVTGELSGTWGDVVNTSITSLLDSAIAGTTTLSSDVDVTLTTTQGVANTSREAIILWTAGGTATRTITVPAQSKIYTVINKTSSTQSIKIVGAGPTTGVTIIAGEATQIAWNGVDFVKVGEYGGDVSFRNVTVSSLTDSGLTSGRVTYATTAGLLTDSANLTFNGTTLTANTLNLTNQLTTAYGGTGLTSYTAGDLPYYATGTALSKLGIGTSGQILTSSGTAPQWSTLSGVAVTTFSAGTTGFTPSSATSGAVTLGGTLATTNGGTGLTSFTANGVVYASSTSALATGSALTFDGSKLATLNANASFTSGSSSTAGVITSGAAGSQGVIQFGSNQTTYNIQGGPDYLGMIYNVGSSTYQHIWQINGSEQMRLTSTGLGIGTSSPQAKLQIAGASNATVLKVSSTDQASGMLSLGDGSSTTNNVGVYRGQPSALSNGNWLNLGGYDGIAFTTGNNALGSQTERMRLDSSGNLGIGTSSPTQKLEVRTATDKITQFLSGSGTAVQWQTINDAKTANVPLAISTLETYFLTNGSERMRLDSSGNLGIGTSSPTEKLEVSGNAAVTGTGYLALQRQLVPVGENGTVGLNFRWYSTGTTYTTGAAINATSAAAWTSVSAPARLEFLTTASGSTTPTIRATLDSSGNLGLGVTPSASWTDFTVFQNKFGAILGYDAGQSHYTLNAYYQSGTWKYLGSNSATKYSQVSGNHAWYTAPSGTAGNAITFTQAMTLDSSGNLLVGTTSSNPIAANAVGTKISGGSLNLSNSTFSLEISRANTTGEIAYWYYNNSTIVGNISITSVATLYNTTSDQRLKENIVDAPELGNVIDSIKVRSYDWKSDGSHQRAGFVAQELVTVAPEAVHQPADPEQMMAVDYSKLVPMLVKEIQSLRKRLADAGI